MYVYLPGERGRGPMLRPQGAEERARRVGSSSVAGRRLFRAAAAPARRAPSAQHRAASRSPRPARLGSARRDAPGGKGAMLRPPPLAQLRRPGVARGDAPSSFHTLGPGTRSAFGERSGNVRFLPPRWGRKGGGDKWYSKIVSWFVLF